jgi:hypothetical protein
VEEEKEEDEEEVEEKEEEVEEKEEDEEEVEEKEEIDISMYDYTKPSINTYVRLFDSMNVRLSNIKSNRIDLDLRKQKAFEVLMKRIKMLDLDEEKLKQWKVRLDCAFGIAKQEKVKVEKPPVDLSQYRVGQVVMTYADYKDEKDMMVKCVISKINKTSLTLLMHDSLEDERDVRRALQQQTHGYKRFHWTGRFLDKKIVRTPQRVITDGALFNHYLEYGEKSVDFGN